MAIHPLQSHYPLILEYLDVSALKGRAWNCVEFATEHTVEATLKRLCYKLPVLFRKDPVELFCPMLKRDLDIFETAASTMMFARSRNTVALGRLCQCTGVLGLVMSDENAYRYKNAIIVQDEYIQTLIAEDQQRHEKLSAAVKIGSFVRIIDGETKGYCGTVESLTNTRAVVLVQTTRRVYIDTMRANLLVLDVPANKRHYYFCSLVEDLDDSFLLPIFVEETQPVQLLARIPTSRDASATQSIIRMVKTGTHNPLDIATMVLAGFQAGDIQPPVRNLVILATMIKNSLLDWEKQHAHPKWRTWRELALALGEPYKSFSPMQIAAACPDSGIGIETPPDIVRRVQCKRTKPASQFPQKKRSAKSSS
jgi:hypothetical protein